MEQSQDLTYFTPLKIGDFTLKNRILVAPLTRVRCNPQDGVPNDLLVEYYAQRASFGLILTECSQVSPRSGAFPGSAGIYSEEQVQYWKRVIDAVHQKGGLIWLQIWHCGRSTNPESQGGLEAWGPSPIAIRGKNFFTAEKLDYPVPHEMTADEIEQVVKEFRVGAENAKRAGFDGVQLHGANGYLVDQFLRDGSNKRTDNYGGSVENRSRFCLEVMAQLVAVFGKGRVAIRVSPTDRYNDMYDSDPVKLYSYLFGKLQEMGIAFIEIKEQESAGLQNQKYLIGEENQPADCAAALRSSYNGILIGNEGLDEVTGLKRIQSGVVQAVSFGKYSICNPDFPERIQNHFPICRDFDYITYFAPGPQGYTTYKRFDELSFFDPLPISKDFVLKNRIMLAPLTRQRCEQGTLVPNKMVAEYYGQRAGFGLIISECTTISPRSQPFPGQPGIFNEDQVNGWKLVTDEVHQKGGLIIMQIWHSGRATVKSLQNDLESWAPSAIAIRGKNVRGNCDQEVPHEMTKKEIEQVIQEFRMGAENAKKAGFDGIQLHGANGYLVDQFLRESANQRTDEYGGSVENRCRFCLQVIDELIKVFGKDKVSLRVSPTGRCNDIFDSDPIKLYSYLLQKLSDVGIGFIEIKEQGLLDNQNKTAYPRDESGQPKDVTKALRQYFNGILVGNDGLDEVSGLERIKSGLVQAVSYGKLGICNPDLVERIKNNWPLDKEFDSSTYYSKGEEGYTTYRNYVKPE